METHVIWPIGVEMEGEKTIVDAHIGGRVDDSGLCGLGQPERPYSRPDQVGPMQRAVMALPAMHPAWRFALAGRRPR